MKANKLLTGTVSIVCAGAMLVAGAFALQGNQSIINRFFGAGDPFVPPEIVEDHDVGMLGKKEVVVENNGNAVAYVRVNLGDYLDITAPIPTNAAEAGTHGFTTNMPSTTVLRPGATASDFTWTFNGASVMTRTEYILAVADLTAGQTMPAVWLYDTDGWAYWTAPLMPGDVTDMFLTAVNVKGTSPLADVDAEYYYAVNVGLQWVTQEDLGLWAGKTTTAAHPTEPGQSPAQAAAQTYVQSILEPYYLNPPVVAATITMADGTKLIKANATDPTANARVYKQEDGTYIYYGGAMTDLVNGGTLNPADIFNAAYAENVIVEGTAITTNWYFKNGTPTYVPLYTTGVNYAMTFHRGATPGLYDGDETFAMPLPANQILKDATQIDNFDY